MHSPRMHHRYLAAAFLLAAGLWARTAAAQEAIPGPIVAGPPIIFGPFANATGTDKIFRFVGDITVATANTTPRYRFCWGPTGGTTLTRCSQWVTTGTGTYAPGSFHVDTGDWWLPGACPTVIWLEIFSNFDIQLVNGVFTHVCGGVPNPPGANKVFTTMPLAPSKKIGLSFAGAPTGAQIRFRMVANGAACDVAASVFSEAGITPSAQPNLCPLQANLLKTLATGLNSAPNVPGLFPSVTDCFGIQRIDNDPRGQWDVCVGDGITWTKVAGQVITGIDPNTGVPIFTFVSGSATVGGVTVTGVFKGKHAVPALSTAGVVALSGIMLALAIMMLRRNRRAGC